MSVSTQAPPAHRAKSPDEGSLARAIASTVLTAVTTVMGLAVTAGILASALGFYRLDTVLSGSMKPTYAPGDVVIAREKPANQVAVGDVIMFNTPAKYGGSKVTHRVAAIKMDEDGAITIRTKGDNNNAVDPWNAVVSTPNVWVIEGRIPKVGYLANLAQSWWTTLLAVLVSAPMLAFARRRVADAYAPRPRHAADPASPAQNDSKDGAA